MVKWKFPKKPLLVCLKLIKIKMNFFDCFMYNNEELLLDLRLNILSKYVKKFILVESAVDHQGNKKKNFFQIDKFNKFKDKIIHIKIDHFPKKFYFHGTYVLIRC